MGRKPIPPKLNILIGNPSKRPLKAPLAPPWMLTSVPEPPEASQDMPGVVKVWNRVATDLVDRQLMAAVDRDMLAIYCVACDAYFEACSKLNEMGYLIPTERGGMKQNPWVSIRNQSAKTVCQTGALFGLSPLTRLALTGNVREKPVNDREANYFDGA